MISPDGIKHRIASCLNWQFILRHRINGQGAERRLLTGRNRRAQAGSAVMAGCSILVVAMWAAAAVPEVASRYRDGPAARSWVIVAEILPVAAEAA